jgi:hypothetical protein
MGDSTLSCQRLYILLEEQKVVGLIAQEKVKIVTDGNTATADKLRWDEKMGLAFLVGHPLVRLYSKDFQMEAPVVWYHREQRRFSTRGDGILLRHLPPPKPQRKPSK